MAKGSQRAVRSPCGGRAFRAPTSASTVADLNSEPCVLRANFQNARPAHGFWPAPMPS